MGLVKRPIAIHGILKTSLCNCCLSMDAKRVVYYLLYNFVWCSQYGIVALFIHYHTHKFFTRCFMELDQSLKCPKSCNDAYVFAKPQGISAILKIRF